MPTAEQLSAALEKCLALLVEDRCPEDLGPICKVEDCDGDMAVSCWRRWALVPFAAKCGYGPTEQSVP